MITWVNTIVQKNFVAIAITVDYSHNYAKGLYMDVAIISSNIIDATIDSIHA